VPAGTESVLGPWWAQLLTPWIGSDSVLRTIWGSGNRFVLRTTCVPGTLAASLTFQRRAGSVDIREAGAGERERGGKVATIIIIYYSWNGSRAEAVCD
jgi:hypothetical protein